ncbi:TrkA C-terminal domain-containing protein [Aneurinibacillus sp. BA2021]|nr:TrkA C-terminal domain-containing protein [Aneurinibacillus sp. BA2021]
MLGIAFILMYFLIIALVIEISTVLLTMTGLDKDVARFQAVSMLTGTGFTTGESELVARHPIRRRLGMFLILFGAFSLAVIISAISTLLTNRSGLPQLGTVIAVLLLVWSLMKIKRVENYLYERMVASMKKVHVTHELPIEDVLFIGENDSFTEVHIFQDSELIGKNVGDCIEDEADMNVLFIKRGEEVIRKSLHKATIQDGDTLLVYGDHDTIEQKFGRELKHMEQLEKEENRNEELI